MQLLTTLRSDLMSALKASDSAKVSVIRSLQASIANAEAVPLSPSTDAVGVYAGDAARRSIGVEDVRRLLEGEKAERTGAAGEYADRAAIERMHREIALIEGYLSLL